MEGKLINISNTIKNLRLKYNNFVSLDEELDTLILEVIEIKKYYDNTKSIYEETKRIKDKILSENINPKSIQKFIKSKSTSSFKSNESRETNESNESPEYTFLLDSEYIEFKTYFISQFGIIYTPNILSLFNFLYNKSLSTFSINILKINLSSSLNNLLMNSVYLLELENNKYYVGITNNFERRLNEHKNGNGSIQTKKHKFVRVIKVLKCIKLLDIAINQNGKIIPSIFIIENIITLFAMGKYGIENVQGGKYVGSKHSLANQLNINSLVKLQKMNPSEFINFFIEM